MYLTVQCSSLQGCNFQLDINLPCINGLNTFHLSISHHVSFPPYNLPLGFVFFLQNDDTLDLCNIWHFKKGYWMGIHEETYCWVYFPKGVRQDRV